MSGGAVKKLSRIISVACGVDRVIFKSGAY